MATTYPYVKHLLRIEYGEDLVPNQVIAKLNERTKKTHETSNEYAAALIEIGQGCKNLEEWWFVNAFKRGAPQYV